MKPVWILTAILFSGSVQAKETHIQLILDGSGSMFKKLPEGQSRIEAAKSVLSHFLEGVQNTQGLNVGLRVYGAGQSGSSNKCTDSKLITPMQGFQKAAIQKQVNATTPKGATPIVFSLLEAAKDFPKNESKKLIVLVTDGEESCGGRFSDVTSQFKKLGIEVDVRIIGIDLNEKAKTSFKGFGSLENIRSGADLGKALNRAVDPVNKNYALEASQSVGMGNKVSIKWTGPNNEGDYITIVPKGAKIGAYDKYFYTKKGNPSTLDAPLKIGEYEIRYNNEKVSPNPTMASIPLVVTKNRYSLSAPQSVGTGDKISIKWTGPNNKGDYVTIVPKGAKIGAYTKYFYTKAGNPGTIDAPLKAGEYEIRYSSEQVSPNPILASIPISVNENKYALQAPKTAKAGSTIQVKWLGPNNKGDYVTVVPKDAKVGAYTKYFYTKTGNPGQLKMPTKPGVYEIRYSSEQASPNPTLASIEITIK